MATSKEFIDFLLGQVAEAGEVSAKRMFGEYGLFLGGKMVAVACDNQLFLKPSDGIEPHLRVRLPAPPYPGAKDYFLIEELEDREYLCGLLQLTEQALPLPKERKKKKPSMKG